VHLFYDGLYVCLYVYIILGRTYAVQEDAMDSEISSLTSDVVAAYDPPPSKLGPIWKQGSGKGFFANTKWKEKLMCVGLGGFCMYFDSTEIASTNKAAKIISLQSAYIGKLSLVDDSHSH
jgi:hypothetical protein